MTPALRQELLERQRNSQAAFVSFCCVCAQTHTASRVLTYKIKLTPPPILIFLRSLHACSAAAGVQAASNRVFGGFSMGVASLSAPMSQAAAAPAFGGGRFGGGVASAAAPAERRGLSAMMEGLSMRAAAFRGAGGGGGASAPPPGAPPAANFLERALMASPSAAADRLLLVCKAQKGASAEEADLSVQEAMVGLAQEEMAGSAGAAELEMASASARLSAAAAGEGAYQAVVPLAAAAAAGPGGDGGLGGALEGLRAEPASDAACASGFAVFTTYLDKVTEIRGSAIKVYTDASALLPEEGKAALKASFGSLDSAANLGVEDPPPGQWIVYGMAKKCSSNQALIAQLVHSLETKLALLTGEVDCPMCLESVGGERPAHILACCHKTCKECWQNWSNVCTAQHRQPFCPLCRGPAEFLEVLNTPAPPR
jgi:hypothetical protein